MSRVIIRIDGGIPEVVSAPDGVVVEVHDYDLQAYDYDKGIETGEIQADKDGEEYWRKIL